MDEPGRIETWLTGHVPGVGAYLERVRDPILADRSLDLMSAAFWACLSAWGIASALTGLPTIGLSTNDTYQTIWGGSIGILCLLAFYGAISTFFSNPNILARIKRKRLEMYAGGIVGGFIFVYPALLAVQVIFVGDFERFALIFAALTFLVVPSWRVRHLYHRIRKLGAIANEDTGEIEVIES